MTRRSRRIRRGRSRRIEEGGAGEVGGGGEEVGLGVGGGGVGEEGFRVGCACASGHGDVEKSEREEKLVVLHVPRRILRGKVTWQLAKPGVRVFCPGLRAHPHSGQYNRKDLRSLDTECFQYLEHQNLMSTDRAASHTHSVIVYNPSTTLSNPPNPNHNQLLPSPTPPTPPHNLTPPPPLPIPLPFPITPPPNPPHNLLRPIPLTQQQIRHAPPPTPTPTPTQHSR